MTNKFTLTGTINDGFRHRYSIRKNEDFKEAFIKFMVNLEFEGETIKNRFEYYDYDVGKLIKLKIKEIEDICDHYENKKYDVDIFYGRFKIIIIVRTKKRMPMVNYLAKKAGWIKPLKIKKLKERKEITISIPKLLTK